VSEHVVDLFESVKVKVDEATAAPRAVRNQFRQMNVKRAAIEQPGERVVLGGKVQLRRATPDRAHVFDPPQNAISAPTNTNQQHPVAR